MEKNLNQFDLEERLKMEGIDIGGTPSNILAKDKRTAAYALGIKPEQFVMILDPFDLSRAERRFPFGEKYKTKYVTFEVDVPNGNVNLSSELVSPPSVAQIEEDFHSAKDKIIGRIIGDYSWRIKDKEELKRRYDSVVVDIKKIAQDSKNLRKFMNAIVDLMFPGVKKEWLEEIFSQNPAITYDLMRRFNIPARVICPKCNTFRSINLGQDLECCNVSSDEIIKSGRFIPEEGFFPVLAYLNGYSMLSEEGKESTKKAKEILKDYGLENANAVIEYKKPAQILTIFESFLLDSLLKEEK